MTDVSGSPNQDFARISAPSSILLRGRFETSVRYKCRFTYGEIQAESIDGVVSCSGIGGFTCGGSLGDELTCIQPRWTRGFKASVLSVVRWVDRWVPLIQRVCLQRACGYLAPVDRTSDTWSTLGSDRRLHPSMEGTKTNFYFLTDGGLFEFGDRNESASMSENFRLASPLKPVMGCEGPSCMLRSGQCYGGGSTDGSPCFANDDGCSGHGACIVPNRFLSLGVSSYTHLVDGNSNHFILSANFWDGSTTAVNSAVFAFDSASTQVTMVQEIPTYGARKWAVANVSGQPCVIVANYDGPVTIFPWTSVSSRFCLLLLLLLAWPSACDLL